MRKSIVAFVIGCAVVLLLTACSLGTLSGGKARGELSFDFDLSYPASKGFLIDQVEVTLTHKATGTVVTQSLQVDAGTNQASGTVRNLRTGSWELVVELYELGVVVGSGTKDVEIVAGQTAEVRIRMKLDTGDLDIVVVWGAGDMVFNFDLREFISNGYDVTGFTVY
jgi:hypothetical protein